MLLVLGKAKDVSYDDLEEALVKAKDPVVIKMINSIYILCSYMRSPQH